MSVNNQNQSEDVRMDWDSSLQDDGLDRSILDEGDYTFVIRDFRKDFFNGSEKIGPCPKAVITLGVISDDGKEISVRTSLLLYRPFEWKISSFFRAIGQKKRGEDFTPDWDSIIGTRGRAHFQPRTYTAKDGTKKEANDVEYFIDWDDESMNQLDSQEEEWNDEEFIELP